MRVSFSKGIVSVDNDNGKAKLDKLKSALNLWSSREFSYVGRTMILNVLGASHFWHVAKVLVPPNWVSDSYKSIAWPFIWNGKMEYVSRERCCAPVSKGGLNIVDFPLKCVSLRLSNLRATVSQDLTRDLISPRIRYLLVLCRLVFIRNA